MPYARTREKKKKKASHMPEFFGSGRKKEKKTCVNVFTTLRLNTGIYR